MALVPSQSGGGEGGMTEEAYAERDTNFNTTATTAAGADTVLTAPAVVIASTAQIVTVSVQARAFDTPGGAVNRGHFIHLWQAVDGAGATDLGEICQVFGATSIIFRAPLDGVRRMTGLTPGSYVFSARAYVTAVNAWVYAGAGGAGTGLPAFIRVLVEG